MKRLVAALALLGLLLLAGATSASTTLPQVISNNQPGSKALAIRPRLIIYSGDGAGFLAGRGSSARHPGELHWKLWGRTEARGWGADWLDNCSPNCAGGTYHAYRATVHLYRPRQLGRHLVFTRLTMVFTGARPPYPAYKSGRSTLRALYDSQYNDYYWH
jgi:hypothetical protein